MLFGKKAGTAVGARCRSWSGYRVGGEEIMRYAARAREDGIEGTILGRVFACSGKQNGLSSSSCD